MTGLYCAGAVLVLLAWPALVAAACNASIPLTRPDVRYVAHDDGTVTDTVTGLMWKQCAEGVNSTMAPCDTGSAEVFTWQQAMQHVETVNAGKPFAYDDWRVPTLKELKSLTELACFNPAINNRVFPNTPARLFWSATPVMSMPGSAWGVSFFYGGDSWREQKHTGHLRLVRGER